DLRDLALTPAGRNVLHSVHVRLYSEADYLERWNTLFGWDATPPQAQLLQQDAVQQVLTELARRKTSRRALAAGIGEDPSFLGKVLSGKKRMPGGLLERAQAWLAGPDGEPEAAPVPAPPPAPLLTPGGSGSVLPVALAYAARGWSVVPQRPGSKRPRV